MASRRVLPGMQLAGLERTARLAGEAFGHEDAMTSGFPAAPISRWVWLAAAIMLAGLLAVGLR